MKRFHSTAKTFLDLKEKDLHMCASLFVFYECLSLSFEFMLSNCGSPASPLQPIAPLPLAPLFISALLS